MTTRVPPSAVDVEQAVLGTILNDWQAAAIAIGELTPQAFYETSNRLVFAAMQELFRRGEQIDTITVSEELRRREELDRVGGPYYLTELSARMTFGADSVKRHAMILVEKAMLRDLIRTATEAVSQAYSPDADAFDVVERLQGKMGDIAVGGFRDTHIREGVREAREELEQWLKGERPDRFPTGIYRLDKQTGGFPVGEVTIIAAQTGAGKTSLAVQMVKSAALRAKKSMHPIGAVLLVSIEMTRRQITHRAASSTAGVNLEVLASGQASDYAVEEYRKALDLIETLEIHVDDESSPSLTYIAARCEQIKAQHGLALVVVDYDEKVQADGESEERRVSLIAQGLKSLAKRLVVPVVALSQYNRKGEANYGPPSDEYLRQSGKKTQEAALVIHWYWPGYFVERGVPEESLGFDANRRPIYDRSRHGRGWLIVTKTRFGKPGRVEVEFEQELTRFVDHYDPEHAPVNRRRAYVPQGDQYEFAPTDDKLF